MSKLADKIKKATRLQQTHTLGFGASRHAVETTMVLAAIARDAKSAADLVQRGADAVIVDLAGGAPAPVAAKDGAVYGARIAGTADNEAKACKDAGYDFVVFDPDKATATALLEENVGYVISPPADLTDAELRTLESFQLDAIDIGAIKGALTVRRQIALRRVFGLTHKPLMAAVNAAISVSELQALRDTNVVIAVADSADAVERLRKTIDALPPRARRKDGEDRPVPLVPRSTAGDGDEEEHDHDHD